MSTNPLNPLGSSIPEVPKIPNTINPLAGLVVDSKIPGIAPPMMSKKPSEYTLVFPEGFTFTEEIKAIAEKRVEDMTQEELRKVYFNIQGTLGKPIYSASEINFIDKRGRMSESTDFEESDSLFIGDQIHKAMETDGANLRILKSYEDLGPAPVPPALDLTPGEMNMVAIMAEGGKPEEAVFAVRNNAVTKAVTPEMMREYLTEGTETKEIMALKTSAKKETAKITKDHIDKFKRYLNDVALYNKRKQVFEQPGDLIVDNLSYRKMGAARIINTIKSSFNALYADEEVMELYKNGKTGKGEAFTEHVILWKYSPDGTNSVLCKSMLDRMVKDTETKTLTILDIKTHSSGKGQFVHGNYKSYSYFRSMAFYDAAARYMLQQEGHNPAEWTIHMILLPVSTAFFETGTHFTTGEISPVDISSGTYGGFVKPFGTIYNEAGQIQIFMDGNQYRAYEALGAVHPRSRDLHRKGWINIIDENEKSRRLGFL